MTSDHTSEAAIEASPATRQWISVVLLQGDEADQLLDLIDRRGTDAAITELAQWDFGDETTDAALANGYVDDGIPVGATGRATEDATGTYALTYNTHFGYVSLLRSRARAVNPDEEITSLPAMRPARVERDWFATSNPTASTSRRDLAR